MKVQCSCGAKYSIDVTPEMARDPVRFVCPNCDTDLSGPINDLVHQELGQGAAPASAPMRVPLAPAAPAKLAIHKSESTATHGTAVEAARDPAGSNADDGKPCPKHRGEVVVEHCYVCRKPMCPKCMELFGYVCSPLCRAKAEANGIHVPVFAGQKSVMEAKRWKKTGRIGMAIAAAVILLVGGWIWWEWFGSYPHAVFSVTFPERSYAGNSRIVGKQIVFLHGGLLARYPLNSKTAVWTNEIVTAQQVQAETDRQMNEYKAMLDNAIRRGSDFRPHVPLREELEVDVRQELEASLRLFVQDQNIWIARDGSLTKYDWDTGKPGKQVKLPGSLGEATVNGDELRFLDENAFGQQVVTHVSLASGESRAEEIGERKSSAVLAQTKPANGAKPNSAAKGSDTTGLPTQPGVDMDKPMDPAKVASDAQKLPYAGRLALPATLSNTRHQNEILKELKADEEPDMPPGMVAARNDALAGGGMGVFGHRGFLNSKYGYVEWSSKVLEQKGRARTVMKAKPARSALEDNPSVTNTTAIANEILNDMQRENGDSITEDVSRYQVTVHRPEAKEVADWTGEVIGPPSVFEQKTVTVVAGLQMLVVLDKNNKQIWQANLAYNIGHGSELEDDDGSRASFGQGPCVEEGDALYVYDEAGLTAYELANGNVRWHVPTIGIVGLFFDGQGSVYVNSTTAGLDTIRFARQIDIDKKVTASVLRVDGKTGKVLWAVQPGGFVSHVEGKYVFCFASHQADDNQDPDSLTTVRVDKSVMDIRRLNPKNGKQLWDYADSRSPLSVRFKGNVIELVFRKEVQVLKFLTL